MLGRERNWGPQDIPLSLPLCLPLIDSFIFRVLQEVILDPRVASKLLNPWTGSSVLPALFLPRPPGGTVSQVLVPPLMHRGATRQPVPLRQFTIPTVRGTPVWKRPCFFLLVPTLFSSFTLVTGLSSNECAVFQSYPCSLTRLFL